jgi:chromatin remodeling complex protein RSC6
MAKQSSKTSTTSVAASTPAVAASTPSVEKVAKAPKAEKSAAAVSTPAVEKVAKAPKAEKVAASTPAVAAPSVPAAEKVAKAPKAPKAAKAVAVASVVVASTDVPVVAEASAAVSVSSEFTDFMSKLQQLSTTISSLKTEFRSLEKKASRELKTAAKASSKRKRKTGNRSPSGFVKPTLISDELATFLGKTTGTEMARTEVTREINAYIRANSLQDTTNGRRINADTKLSSLLKLTVGEELTYFNLQRYMSPHFAKTSAAVVASA